MSFGLKAIIVLLGILAFFVLCLWAYGKYWFATKQFNREIAKDLSIGPDWWEIVPQPPLKIQKRFQHLLLVTDGYDQRLGHTTHQILLSNGTLIEPEIEIVDKNGKSQRLECSGLHNSSIGHGRFSEGTGSHAR
jgi:hypothetical protein